MCPNDKEKKIIFGRGFNNAKCGLHFTVRAMSHWGAELPSELWQVAACLEVTAEVEKQCLFSLHFFLYYMGNLSQMWFFNVLCQALSKSVVH